ncbi:hypothetical protein CsSME_00023514 [Camellia sinensis var. sinensis]
MCRQRIPILGLDLIGNGEDALQQVARKSLAIVSKKPSIRCRKHATSKDIAWEARGGHSVVVLLLMYYI